jgi:hypothetical protein
MGRLLYTLHLEMMKVSGESWEVVVTAICDEGDGLKLCEGHS